jgi:dihydrolipoamide dehydrogenase
MKNRADEFGFSFDNLSYDWGKVIKRSRNVADKNAEGIEYLFKKNKVDYILGEASLESILERPRLPFDLKKG